MIDSAEMLAITEGVSEIGEHTHEFLEIEYVLQGECEQIVRGNVRKAKKGDVMFFNIGESHSYKATAQPFKIINIIFMPALLSDDGVEHFLQYLDDLALSADKLPKAISLSYPQMVDFEEMLAAMRDELSRKQPGYNAILRSYLSVMLIKILRYSGDTHDDRQMKLDPMLKYIEDNLTVTSPSKLAQEYAYTPAYFSRVFKNRTGMTIIEYINKRKIEQAVKLLKETELSVENIAIKTGFSSKKNFYDAFKKYTGMTPNGLRKKI